MGLKLKIGQHVQCGRGSASPEKMSGGEKQRHDTAQDSIHHPTMAWGEPLTTTWLTQGKVQI